MYGITNAGGGSGTKSTLIISIDSGSTVEVYSNSTFTTLIKTATEKTAGQFWVKGLDNGTYYIKATKGTDEATLAYTISEYGVYRITMNYLPEQAINYTLLYDGSLGEGGASGANTMSVLTGGYTNSGTAAQYGGAGTVYADSVVNVYADCVADSKYTGSNQTLQTANDISVSGYQGFGFIGAYVAYHTNASGSTGTGSTIEISLSGETISISANAPDYHYTATGTHSSALADTTKVLRFADFQSVSDSKYQVYVYNRYAGLGIMVNTFSAFMYKSDDTALLADRLGLTNNTTSGILSDANDLAKLFATAKSVQIMCLICTGDFMFNALNNASFIAAYNSSTYKSAVDSNEHWAKFITDLA